MSEALTVHSHFQGVAELAAGLADRVEDGRVILYGPTNYEAGDKIPFAILLADGSPVIEGFGVVAASVDGGEERAAEIRYDVVLTDLEMDARSEIMFSRVLMSGDAASAESGSLTTKGPARGARRPTPLVMDTGETGAPAAPSGPAPRAPVVRPPIYGLATPEDIGAWQRREVEFLHPLLRQGESTGKGVDQRVQDVEEGDLRDRLHGLTEQVARYRELKAGHPLRAAFDRATQRLERLLAATNDSAARSHVHDLVRIERIENFAHKVLEIHVEGDRLLDSNEHQVAWSIALQWKLTEADFLEAICYLEEIGGSPIDVQPRPPATSSPSLMGSNAESETYQTVLGEVEDGAIDKLNEALDTNPRELNAFEAINKILMEKKDWKGLERAYRLMIHRVINLPDMKELQFSLLENLGIIYRDLQKNFDSAAEAFRMASALSPDADTIHVTLAELYTAMDGKNVEAIGEHQWLLKRDPNRVESYRALYALYFDARAYDKAWCVAATLSFLKKADNEQQQFFQEFKQEGMIRPTSRIDNVRWLKLLFHPDEDLVLSKIFELMAVPLFAVKGASDQALNLHTHKPVDVASSDVMFARTFGFVMQVMNLAIQPRLFVLQNVPGGMADQCSKPLPSVVAGNGVLTGWSPQDLMFLIGRHLAYYRGEHFIRTMLQSHTEVRMVLLAALRIAGVGAADPQVDQLALQLVPHFQQAQIDTLRGLCRRFIEAGGSADVRQWMQCVESTAIRAGFLLCNDLETAANLVRQLPPAGTADLPPGDKLKELVLFSVSEQYFALREGLGIQIQV